MRGISTKKCPALLLRKKLRLFHTRWIIIARLWGANDTIFAQAVGGRRIGHVRETAVPAAKCATNFASGSGRPALETDGPPCSDLLLWFT